jgi:hypothetical protein
MVSMIIDFQDEQEFMLVLGLWMTLPSRSTYFSVARMAPLMGCLLSPEVKLGGAYHLLVVACWDVPGCDAIPPIS